MRILLLPEQRRRTQERVKESIFTEETESQGATKEAIILQRGCANTTSSKPSRVIIEPSRTQIEYLYEYSLLTQRTSENSKAIAACAAAQYAATTHEVTAICVKNP